MFTPISPLVGHRRGGHAPLDRLFDPRQALVAVCHCPLHRPLGDRAAEYLGQHRGGPPQGQQLLLGQIHRQRGHPRTVLHRGRHIGRKRAARLSPTPWTAGGRDPMFDHPRPHGRDVHDLPPLPALHRDTRQALPAASTLRGGVLLHRVGLRDKRQTVPGVPHLAPRWPSTAHPLALWVRRDAGPIRGGGLPAVAAVRLQLGAQGSVLRPQRRVLSLQHPHTGGPRLQLGRHPAHQGDDKRHDRRGTLLIRGQHRCA